MKFHFSQRLTSVILERMQINFLFYLTIFLILFSISFCKRKPYEIKIKEAIQANDHMTIAALCSEYKFDEYKSECESSLVKSEQEIEDIISQRQEVPFMKLILDPDKSIKIQELLRANIQLGIKYRSIWNETVEIYKE